MNGILTSLSLKAQNSCLPDQLSRLLGLEEEDGAVAEVEVDEVLCLCGDGQQWISI